MNLYGFHPEKKGTLERAGMLRNLFRHTEKDGLRIMALLARFCEANEDPVKDTALD
jgi:hypothetical protein